MSLLKIIPLGGLGEIGMNCLVLEYQEEILLIDCGLLFSDLDHFGVEFIIPDFSYLVKKRECIRGIVITHGHEDHVGALPFLIKAGIKAPIYASPFSLLLIRERMKEYSLSDKIDLQVFQLGDILQFKNFKIKTVSVNHSIVDAAALIIDTPVGKIIHTGDFKIDPTPFFGDMIDLDTFSQAGDQGVLLLLSDSTNVEKHEHTLSESVIYQKFEQLFAAAEGLTVISMFASNVSRMGQIFDLAKKLNKKIALTGRTMEQNVRLGTEVGYLNYVDSNIIPLSDIDLYDRKEVIVLSTGSQGESRSALTRIANGEHGQIKIKKGDSILMSSKFIPGNEKAIGKMINQLFKQGAHVLYEAVHDIHVSGHATRPELADMLKRTRPKFFIPIHGEYRHLVHHSILAKENGIAPDHVIVAVNGDVIELGPHSCQITSHMEENRIFVEGREGNDVSKLVLKERRQLGEKGVVFVLLVRNIESRRVVSGPEIISKGLTHEEREAWILEESKKIAKKIIHKYDVEVSKGGPVMDLQETIRIELRRFFLANIGKKPTVLPIVLDI